MNRLIRKARRITPTVTIPNLHAPKDPKEGDLCVWWIPKIPGEAFTVSISSIEEGAKLMDILAAYDGFQFDHRIKGDYANTGGINRWEADDGDGKPGWCSWYDEETGIDDVTEYLEEKAHTLQNHDS